jgi:hypothetical protein
MYKLPGVKQASGIRTHRALFHVTRTARKFERSVCIVVVCIPSQLLHHYNALLANYAYKRDSERFFATLSLAGAAAAVGEITQRAHLF